jgi:vacuolar protein sorting-associated protein 45
VRWLTLWRAFRQDIFVFVVGGATYEEARAVALLNAANKSQRIILGGTCMLSSASFLKDMEKAVAALQ